MPCRVTLSISFLSTINGLKESRRRMLVDAKKAEMPKGGLGKISLRETYRLALFLASWPSLYLLFCPLTAKHHFMCFSTPARPQ
jgi:hypothetical protein